ncbi:MAG: MerR family transcriptional regulator [Oscillospiraceae bacterium]|nr:MerR family transcriptional regulator [Oscillospiraceae bacterium]
MSAKYLSKDYLTVTQLAKIAGVTPETLRYYDRIGLFHPEKLISNVRYYCPTQITALKMINVLKEIGIPLEVIKTFAKQRTPEAIIKLLVKQKNAVEDRLRFDLDVHSIICTTLELLTEGIYALENELAVLEMPERRIILGNINEYNDSSSFNSEFTRFCIAQNELALNLSYPVGGYFSTMDDFVGNPSKPTRFFTIDPKGKDLKEEGLYLVGYTRGNYGQVNDLPKKMTEFAETHNLHFSGPVFHTYLFDEISIVDKDNYLLQVAASVCEKIKSQPYHPNRA